MLEAPGPPPPVSHDTVLWALSRNAAILRAVQTLIQGATAGELESDLLVERWAEYLQAWARRTKSETWVSGTVRVGEPLRSDTHELMVPVRVYTADKQAVGWVVLVPQGTGYLVSDVQLVPQDRKPGPFDPEAADQPTSRPNLR